MLPLPSLLPLSLPLSLPMTTTMMMLVLTLLVSTGTAVASKISDLPWGDINVMVVTDVHSWVNSHAPKEPYFDADYGAVLSLHHHLQQYAVDNNKPFLFVMNGDFLDGTGLTTYPPYPLISIIKRMPFDLVNIGNHELYTRHHSTILAMLNGKDGDDGMIRHFPYLTSNIELDNGEMLGDRYKLVEVGDQTVLAFGFLYNMQNHCKEVHVKAVEHELESSWFRDVLAFDEFDAILVLAHFGVDDPLVSKTLTAIRAVVGPDFPIQFVTGHTHIRANKQLDDAASSFEAGHYLDTVGFLSFPTNTTMHNEQLGRADTTTATSSSSSSLSPGAALFRHVFLDANVEKLQDAVGIRSPSDFFTAEGRDLQELIRTTREDLGLTTQIGCTNTSLFLDRPLTDPESLWGFYRENLINSVLFKNDTSKILFQSSGAFRFDLLKGSITMDNLISVAAYNDTYYEVAQGLTGEELTEVLGHLPNTDTNPSLPAFGDVPKTIVSVDDIVESQLYDLVTVEFEKQWWSDRVTNVTGKTYPIESMDMWVTQLWQNYITDHMNDNCPPPTSPQNPAWTPLPQSSGRSFFARLGLGPVKLSLVLIAMAVMVGLAIIKVVRFTRRMCEHMGYSTTAQSQEEESDFDNAEGPMHKLDFEMI